MIETKPLRVDYRRLNPICTYCPVDATIIAVVTMSDGDVLVKTLCEEHGLGEQANCRASGMALMGSASMAGVTTDATLIDPDAMRDIAEQMDAEGFDSNSMQDAADDIEAVSILETVKLRDYD